jgi:hypothetical protein
MKFKVGDQVKYGGTKYQVVSINPSKEIYMLKSPTGRIEYSFCSYIDRQGVIIDNHNHPYTKIFK